MPENAVFKRIVLKISGEALQGSNQERADAASLARISQEIKKARDLGTEVALVVGGGNFFRGLTGTTEGVQRNTGDYVGMLATIMNAMLVRDVLIGNDIPCCIHSALEITGVAPVANLNDAKNALNEKQVVIFAGGTGHPYFTTDTTAALRACEINAQAVLKATKVDGIYSADPEKDPNAARYDKLTFQEAITKRLAIMDSTAFSLCYDNNIPIVVFNFLEQDGLKRVLEGNTQIATFVG